MFFPRVLIQFINKFFNDQRFLFFRVFIRLINCCSMCAFFSIFIFLQCSEYNEVMRVQMELQRSLHEHLQVSCSLHC